MSKKKSKEKGCENCNNTGLEPNVSRDVAQVCPVCNGSPFGEGERPSVPNPEPEKQPEEGENEE